jgi:adenine/guanine phosphoribosyltransferase-like PRPP-binding protein
MNIYQKLTTQDINNLTHQEIEKLILGLLAERGTVTGGGKILRWSEFNENPDPLINELLARILVDQIQIQICGKFSWNQMVVMSIENSATYLATAISYEITRVCKLTRPPRIIRARKLPVGEKPSPALGNEHFNAEVKPITAGGESRYIIASKSTNDDFDKVKLALVVDDFKATGSTLDGGVRLVREMFDPQVIIPMAALGKPEQENETATKAVKSAKTAIDITFWGDKESGKAYISVNGYRELVMRKANSDDFVVY